MSKERTPTACPVEHDESMRTTWLLLISGTLWGLLCLCCCAAENRSLSLLPGDVVMNQDAGRGEPLIVPVRVESGEEMPFLLDTGSSVTLLDKSLEPRLGKRLYTTFDTVFGVPYEADVCAAPKLYLGNAALRMRGTNVLILDLRQIFPGMEPPIRGIIGIDILEHYCIQLDFKGGKVRFLKEQRANKNEWGKPFSLSRLASGCFWIPDNLAGIENRIFGTPVSMVDTGCSYDGWMTPGLFEQWAGKVAPDVRARFPTCVLDGETYSNVLDLRGLGASVAESGDHTIANGLGLHFLARHLVTLDFPNRTMYLKRTSALPLPPKNSKAALRVLQRLRQRGEAPFWSKDEQASYLEAYSYPNPNSIIITLMKSGEFTRYRYNIARASNHTPWKLQRAWQTDQGGRKIAEYPPFP